MIRILRKFMADRYIPHMAKIKKSSKNTKLVLDIFADVVYYSYGTLIRSGEAAKDIYQKRP